MSEQQTEQMIQGKGKTAPRVTPDAVEANIAGVHYFRASQAVQAVLYDQSGCGQVEPEQLSGEHKAALGLLTFCVIVLDNGFTVTGESACASPENFDPEIGRKIAYDNARAKIWPLMGYHLKQKLHDVNELRQAIGTAE